MVLAMGTSTAVFSLISGLGGSAIGAIAAIYVPLRQLRRQIRETERERIVGLAREEILRLTSLRFAGRAWLDVLLRAEQSLRAGQSVDLERFDEETKEAGAVAAKEGYRVVISSPSVDELAAEIFDDLADATLGLRQAILSGSTERLSMYFSGVGAIQQKREALNARILERIEDLLRSQPEAAATTSIMSIGTQA